MSETIPALTGRDYDMVIGPDEVVVYSGRQLTPHERACFIAAVHHIHPDLGVRFEEVENA